MDAPTLIEPGVRYFLSETLKQCHQFKIKHNNMIVNLYLLIGFVLLVSLVLLFMYKGKPSPEERERRDREKKEYILTKIRNYQDAKLRSQQALITGLPHWDDEL